MDPSSDQPVPLRRGIYLLPNLLTTASLFAGFYAVIVAMNGNFEAAGIVIAVAGVLDGLDGRVARWSNTVSDFGKEYDSLSDMVAFGLAPALVFYQWTVVTLPPEAVALGRLAWIAAFFYTACAALRLARFNSRNSRAPANFFEGLPSPAAAGFLASTLWLISDLQASGPLAIGTGFAVTIGTGVLMVSSLHYYSGKNINLGERIRFGRLLFIPLLFMLIALNPPLVLTIMGALFALSAMLHRVWRRLRRRSAGRAEKAEPQSEEDSGRTGTFPFGKR